MFLSSRICTWRRVLLRYPEDGFLEPGKKTRENGKGFGVVRDDYSSFVVFFWAGFLLGAPPFFLEGFRFRTPKTIKFLLFF